jgi:hypothetical protein
MKFTIKSERLEHKDQVIELDFSEMKIISELNFDTNKPDNNEYKYEGKSSFARYIGASRIDGFPIFEIDTFQLDREEKISQILK